MKVKFNAPRELDGVHYTVGTHEMPDSLASHWYFLAMQTNGTCVIVADTAKVSEAKPKKVPKTIPQIRTEDGAKMAAELQKQQELDAKPEAEKKPEPVQMTDEEKKAKIAESQAKRKATLDAKKKKQ